jgi:hypothetical protein
VPLATISVPMRLSWHARMFVLIVSQAEFSPRMLLDKGAQMRPPVQPTITPAQRQSVVVVGGGFAGLNLIQHLRDAPVNIVLVDRCNHHLFQPLLYQVATAALAPTEIAEPTRSILRNARIFESRFVNLALGPMLKWAWFPKLAPRPRPHKNIGLGGL